MQNLDIFASDRHRVGVLWRHGSRLHSVLTEHERCFGKREPFAFCSDTCLGIPAWLQRNLPRIQFFSSKEFSVLVEPRSRQAGLVSSSILSYLGWQESNVCVPISWLLRSMWPVLGCINTEFASEHLFSGNFQLYIIILISFTIFVVFQTFTTVLNEPSRYLAFSAIL